MMSVRLRSPYAASRVTHARLGSKSKLPVRCLVISFAWRPVSRTSRSIRARVVADESGRDPARPQPGAVLRRFAIAGADRHGHRADARIDEETVLVPHPGFPTSIAVRYAWAMDPEGANLYNPDWLPASPFRSDDW